MASMIELIKELRDRTGAGMMDCKKALEASNSDVEKAIDWLREKGIAKAQAKASRIAAEGLAGVVVKGDKAIIAEVNCETDFVSKGEKFHKLVEDVMNVTLEKGSKNLDEAKDATKALFTDATVSMGEKLDYRRFEVVADIPADVIEHERAIAFETAKADPKLAGKPEQMLQGIVNGKVKKVLSESILLSQAYLLDGEKSVAQVLKESGANVVKFVRYAVGEGIEKRQDNFADEVMKEIK